MDCLFLCLCLLIHILTLFSSVSAINTTIGTISTTHFVSDSENTTLVSPNGKFKLGFFSPGKGGDESKSRARYVGIWFNKVPQQTVVWVANRDSPVYDSTGVFTISESGNLVVFHGSETRVPVWSSNVTNTNVSVSGSVSVSAKLLETGNLILVSQGSVIWQSFDYPTDTILPGMKFGWNSITGLNHVLTSWKTFDDPGLGRFSGKLDHEGIPQFFLYKNGGSGLGSGLGLPYWRSGPWNGRNLNGVPNIATTLKKANYSDQVELVNYTFVNNENGSYYSISSTKNGVLSILVLEASGVMKRKVLYENRNWGKFWMAPQDSCDEYDRCDKNQICNNKNTVHCGCLPGFVPSYPHVLSLKCTEARNYTCGKGKGEGFVKLEAVKLPDARISKFYGGMVLEECEHKCLEMCNCTGFAILDVTGSGKGCVIWNSELRDMRYYQDGQDFYLRVDSVTLGENARKLKRMNGLRGSTLAFMIVPVVVEMIVAVLCFYYLWRRQKLKRKSLRLAMDSRRIISNRIDSTGDDQNGEDDLILFELATLVAATDNFSSANKLGRGGFGLVFQGQLSNGQKVAIKRLSDNSGQGVLEFKNEVLLISKLQHRNLVKLLGYCIDKDERILVYEFMPNKSLDHFIFDQSRRMLLNWQIRFDIIIGIARGILYLHQDSRLTIIHRDLKASNILLDAEMKPKISDFGTARIFEEDETQASTKRVVGTHGYMAPEYAIDGYFSMKSDVFSFGVLLLEIISGKRNRGSFHQSNLIQHTWELWREGKAMEIVDKSCKYESSQETQLERCIQVGLVCVQDKVSDRPSMADIVFMLSNDTLLPYPQKSLFSSGLASANTGPGPEYTLNGVTITVLDGR